MIFQGNIFDNKQFVLNLPLTWTFKTKQELKQKIICQKGCISNIVNKNSNYLLCDKIDCNETYRSRRAKKYAIPFVTYDFIDDCIQAKKLLDHKNYLPDNLTINEKKDFDDGKIRIHDDRMDSSAEHLSVFRFSLVKVYGYRDENGPSFHIHKHTIAKATLLRGKKKKNQIPFCMLEIHVSKEDKMEEIPKYCVFMHNGIYSPETKVNENKLCRYFNDINETMLTYNHLYKQYMSPPHSMTQSNKLISKNIGSDLLCSTEWLLGPISLDPQVKYLINHIWNEAVLDIEDKLSVSLKTLSFDKIETAKMLIWKILCNFQEEEEEITKLWKEFYEVLPHKNQNELETVAEIKEKFLDCQLISDMMAASECFENKSNTTVEEKYQALHCNIETLTSDNAEYHSIISQFVKSNSIIIDNIYKLNHYVDSSEYDGSIGNEKILLHPTKVKDLIGLLPRGLSDFDECYLHGDEDLTHRNIDSTAIYFVDTIEGLLKYTPPSRCCGTRIIMLNQVALGNSKQAVLMDDISFLEDYDSLHCLSHNSQVRSEFDVDEYVIFNSRRQQMKYLIEFHLADDVVKEMTIADEGAKQTSEKEDEETLYATTKNASVDLNQFLNQSDKEIKLKSQLKAEGMPVHLPLKSVHVRASLIDLASEVTVIQEFINNHSETIQGKYIFPLSEKAVVCGFEAFTEGRHFVGRIEEKTEAHQEYHEAVRAGRKAYLMDEESPEVFSVTIGNISPGAVVFIKITYVSELELEGDLIKFLIPESITPVREQDNIIDNKQLITEANDQKSTDAIQTSIEIFLDMPFPIRLITSHTHKLNIKKTETKAVVKINPNDKFSNGFHMLVGLTEIHSPRMWVEESTMHKTEACMIAFYPEFDIPTCEENEIIIALDASNSMQGECFVNAQIISLLCLHFLPENCKFNVIKFGTVFQELFPIAVTKSLGVVQDAQQFVLSSIPEMGNSNIRHLLHSYYLLPPPINTTRNIFIISDGFFNCPNELFSVAAKIQPLIRIFTFGIHQNGNNHLLRGLAISGGGGFDRFDKHLKYKWESKVKKLIDKALEHVLTDVTVDWQRFEHNNEDIIQAPSIITAIFNGGRLLVYGLVSNCSLATVKANIKGHELCSVVYTSDLAKTTGCILHRLATRALVEDWEKGILELNRTVHEITKRDLKSHIIKLSKTFGIVTPLTSFIAIEDKDESLHKTVPSTLKEILEGVNVDGLPYLQYETCEPHTDTNFFLSASYSTNVSNVHVEKNAEDSHKMIDKMQPNIIKTKGVRKHRKRQRNKSDELIQELEQQSFPVKTALFERKSDVPANYNSFALPSLTQSPHYSVTSLGNASLFGSPRISHPPAAHCIPLPDLSSLQTPPLGKLQARQNTICFGSAKQTIPFSYSSASNASLLPPPPLTVFSDSPPPVNLITSASAFGGSIPPVYSSSPNASPVSPSFHHVSALSGPAFSPSGPTPANKILFGFSHPQENKESVHSPFKFMCNSINSSSFEDKTAYPPIPLLQGGARPFGGTSLDRSKDISFCKIKGQVEIERSVDEHSEHSIDEHSVDKHSEYSEDRGCYVYDMEDEEGDFIVDDELSNRIDKHTHYFTYETDEVKKDDDKTWEEGELKLFIKYKMFSELLSINEEKKIFQNCTLTLGSGLPFINALLKSFPQKSWAYKDVSLFSLRQCELLKSQESVSEENSKEDIELVFSFCNELGGIDITTIPQNFQGIVNYFTVYLENAGIKSLAKPIQDATISLLASLAAIIFICVKLCPDLFPLDLMDSIILNNQARTIVEKLCEEKKEMFQFGFYGLLIYIIWINQRYPLVYHTLELGNSWEAALESLITKCKCT